MSNQFILQRLVAAFGMADGLVKVEKRRLAGLVTSAETESGIILPEGAVVLDVVPDIINAVTGKTMDIGTDSTDSGDADGYADALSVAATGLIRPGVSLDGTSNWYATNTRGALLSSFVAGTNADDRGLYLEMPDLASGSKKITYTPADGTADLDFDLYVAYMKLN